MSATRRRSREARVSRGARDLANILRTKGRREEALALYRRGVAHRSGFCRRALQLRRDAARDGGAWRRRSRPSSARPLEAPGEAIHNNLASPAYERNRFAEAVESYRRALAIRPSSWRRSTTWQRARPLGRNGRGDRDLPRGDREGARHGVRAQQPRVILQERGQSTRRSPATSARRDPARPSRRAQHVGYLLQERTPPRGDGALTSALAANPGYARADTTSPSRISPSASSSRDGAATTRAIGPCRPSPCRDPTRFPGSRRPTWARAARSRYGASRGWATSSSTPRSCGPRARVKEFVLESTSASCPPSARASRVERGFAGRVRRGVRALRPPCTMGALRGCCAHARELGAARARCSRPIRASTRLSRAARRPGARIVASRGRSFQPTGRAYVQRKKIRVAGSVRRALARGSLCLLDLQYGDTAAEREAFAQPAGSSRASTTSTSSRTWTACSRRSRPATSSSRRAT